MLAPEFIAREVSISKMMPQYAFAVCGVFPEVTSTSHWGIVGLFRGPSKITRLPLTSILSPHAGRGGHLFEGV